eukprot:m.56321 g.56321  ORF g.56321 m.56321 type:complete len:173 (-) comp13381_c0_seq1:373-891(-)
MSEQQNAAPIFCVRCHAFYGAAHQENMCSSCYKEAHGLKKDAPIPGSSATSSSPPKQLAHTPTAAAASSGAGAAASASAAAAGGATDAVDPSKPVQAKKSRCWKCGTKISLVQQSTNICRCGYVFCDVHRYAEAHECDFDHKESGRSVMAKQLPKHEQARGRGIHRLESAEQ